MVDPKPSQCLVDELLGAGRAADVGLDNDDAALAGSGLDMGNHLDGASGCRVGDVVDGNAGAGAGEGEGDAGADTVLLTGAGDNGDFVG